MQWEPLASLQDLTSLKVLREIGKMEEAQEEGLGTGAYVWFMASNPGVAVKIRVYASHSLAPNLQGDVRLLKKFSHYG